MKNILFVVDEKKMGGVSVLLSDILNKISLKNKQIDIMILHNSGNYLDDLPKNINIIYGTKFFEVVDLSFKEVIKSKKISLIYKKIKLILMMKTGIIKSKIIKERKKCIQKRYDVEVAFKDGFCAIFTAYGDSKKKYHWLHTDYSMYDCTENYKNLFIDVFSKFDNIIGISESVVKKFREKYDYKKTKVIYNLINEKKIIDKSKEFKVSNPKNKINFISVGRFHNMKGYDRLVDVFARLKNEKKLDNVSLRLIGDGPDFNLVKNKIEENNLQDYINLEGLKKNPFPYVKASDVFLMCSRYEPFGLVILEAMILKVPVISCEVASINEIMDKKYGMIVENNEEGLYEGIKKIIENKSIIKKYQNELTNYKYPVNNIIKEIERLLEKE